MLDDLFKRTEHLVQQSVECMLKQIFKKTFMDATCEVQLYKYSVGVKECQSKYSVHMQLCKFPFQKRSVPFKRHLETFSQILFFSIRKKKNVGNLCRNLLDANHWVDPANPRSLKSCSH